VTRTRDDKRQLFNSTRNIMNLRRKQRIENFNKGNEQKGKKGKESYTKNARIREQQIFRNLGSGGRGWGGKLGQH
jgi:hypothetical protein